MNQKNSLGLNKCFLDLDDPFELFEKWFDEAKKKEINDPNALALGTASKTGIPSVRMVLLKGFDKNGFVFYTNLNSQKGNEIKQNPNASMCFHWKSLLRQIRIVGTLKCQQFLFVLINFSNENTLWHLDYLLIHFLFDYLGLYKKQIRLYQNLLGAPSLLREYHL